MIGVTITEKKTGNIDLFLKNLEDGYITVGTNTDYQTNRGASIFEVAKWLDTEGVGDKNKKWKFNEKALKDFENVGKKIFKENIKEVIIGNYTMDILWTRTALEASRYYKDTIQKIKSPALEESTVMNKSRRGVSNPEKPLIDSGNFITNISAQINGGKIVGRGM